MSSKRSTNDAISHAQKNLFLRFSVTIALCFAVIMIGIGVVTLKQLDAEQKKLFTSIASEYQRILDSHDFVMLQNIAVNNPQQMIEHKISLMSVLPESELSWVSGAQIQLKTDALSEYQSHDVPWYQLTSLPNYLTLLLVGKEKQFWLVLDLKPRLDLLYQQWLSIAIALAALSFIISIIVFLLIRSTLSPLHRLANIVDLSNDWTAESLAKLEQEQLEAPNAGLGSLHLSVNRLFGRLISTMNSMENTVDAIAHDLRTPLSRISLAAETSLSKSRTAPDYEARLQHSLSDCAESAEQASQMLTTLMAINDEIINKHPPKMENIDLKKLIEQVSNGYQELAEESGIAIDTSGLQACYAYTDTNRLNQILVNLIDNGIKYGNRNGKLLLSCGQFESGFFYFEVIDDGIGIAEAHHQIIFKRLYRVDSSRTLSGYGLGLAQVKVMLDTLKGRIELQSELDKGTSFKVILPDFSKKRAK